jgi:hypothetical protein
LQWEDRYLELSFSSAWRQEHTKAFSSLAYTTPGDVFPAAAVGTVQGLGGFAGAMSSVIFSALIPGYLIPLFGYTPILIVLSFGYLAAVLVYAMAFGSFDRVHIAVPLEESSAALVEST